MSDPTRAYLRQLIGRNIERGMRAHGWDDTQFAAQLRARDETVRVQKHSVYRWRAGKIGPSKPMLVLIATVLFDGDWTQLLSDRGGWLWSGARNILTEEEEAAGAGRVTITALAERLGEIEKLVAEDGDGVAA